MLIWRLISDNLKMFSTTEISMHSIMVHMRKINIFLLLFWMASMFSTKSTPDIAQDTTNSSWMTKFPIVYVYTVVPAVCKHGLPGYIKESLEQALFTQPDCAIVMISNYAECREIEKTVYKIVNIVKIDATNILSNRTRQFANLSREIFVADGLNELWITSALRFFIMEDFMVAHNFNEILHVEADNMLYGNISSILPILRTGYKGLAATPLTAGKYFITASVFWISDISFLIKFNDFLISMGTNKDNAFMIYLGWLRRYACCKKGGYNPDANGDGIKPFAVNEMSMLAFYHKFNPTELKLFPVVPYYNSYVRNRYICDLPSFGPDGKQVGPSTGTGIWDANSWGQYIGGTSKKRGRDKGFTDSSHITGQAIGATHCKIEFICGNQSTIKENQTAIEAYHEYTQRLNGTRTETETENEKAESSKLKLKLKVNQQRHCYTAPFVRCAEDYPWTPLWNLHVHSKHTMDYRSVTCPCPAD